MRGNLIAYWQASRRVLIPAVAILIVAPALPRFTHFEPRTGQMLQLHLLLELFSVIVSALVVAASWQTLDRERRNEANLLSCGFLAVAAIDLAHALSYDGMPRLVSEGSTQKAVFFWLAARGFAALTLLLVALDPRRRLRRRWLLGASLAATALTLWLGLARLDLVPMLFIEGRGVTALKTVCEYGLLLANICTALLFIGRARPESAPRSWALATACLVLGMCEVMFAHFKAPNEFQSLLGHVFKVLAYVYLAQAAFMSAIRGPYERLARAETALRESEAFSSRIIDTAPDAIIVVDDAGCITRANHCAEVAFGYRQEELVGKPVEMLMPERFRDKHRGHREKYMTAPVQRPMVGGSSIRAVVGRRRDGSEFSVEAGLGPVMYKQRQHVIVVLRDISERLQAQAALTRLNAELEQRVEQRTAELSRTNREMESFSYSVAHDLRAPLRSIEGYSTLLLAEDPGGAAQESRELLRRIAAAALRMQSQISALLSLAQLSRKTLRVEPVDLSAMARSVIADLRQADAARDVEVRIEEGVTAMADPQLMYALLQNLLGNAWKYTGGTTAPVIRFGREGGEFFVADNGAGFDMRHAGHLFEVFQRLHRQEEFAGIGIGLATVRRIVERHGGWIRAEASPGAGATFHFSLGSDAAALVAGTGGRDTS